MFKGDACTRRRPQEMKTSDPAVGSNVLVLFPLVPEFSQLDATCLRLGKSDG
jgi:hypothetical protein